MRSRFPNLRMSLSENRCPPSDQVLGHAFPAHALKLQAVCGGEFFQLLPDWSAAIRLFDQWAKKRGSLAAIDVEQHGLDRTHGGRRQRQRTITERNQRQCADR